MTSIGIIGAGMIANVHAEAAAKVGTTISAVYDPQPATASKFGSKHDCFVASSVDELLSRDDVQGVVIAVPNDLHAALAIESLNAEKDVLLEKPMAMTVQQCQDILRSRDQSGSVLQLGFVCRFAPAAIKAKALINNGAVGRVHHIRATLLRRRGIPGLGGWFTNKARSGGGCLIDIGVHLIDLAMHVSELRDPVRAIGHCWHTFMPDGYIYDEMWSEPVKDGTFDVEDGMNATVGFQDGSTLQLDIAWATHLPENQLQDGVIIDGDQGSMVFDLWGDSVMIGVAEEGKPKTHTEHVDVEDAWQEAFECEHRLFAEAIHSRKLHPDAGSGEDGSLVQSIIEAIYKSDETQKEVAIVH
jgi:predicted dehydrogenase